MYPGSSGNFPGPLIITFNCWPEPVLCVQSNLSVCSSPLCYRFPLHNPCGVMPSGTPLRVGETLFICSPTNHPGTALASFILLKRTRLPCVRQPQTGHTVQYKQTRTLQNLCQGRNVMFCCTTLGVEGGNTKRARCTAARGAQEAPSRLWW